jgi:hypothetical protein
MKTYIGIKVVEAEPQDEARAFPTMNFKPTKDDPLAQGRRGFRVKYPDGYTNWSPADTFEAAYVEMTNGATARGFQKRFLAELDRWNNPPPPRDENCEPEPEPDTEPGPPDLLDAQHLRARIIDLAIGSFDRAIPPNTKDIIERAHAFERFITGRPQTYGDILPELIEWLARKESQR